MGFTAWLLPDPERSIPWTSLLLLAGVEEFVFRGILQGSLSRVLSAGSLLPGLSPANLATSLTFSLLHLLNHPPLWAAAVFFPSLIFGWTKDRFRSLLPCILLHFTYNLLFFSRP